MALKVHSLWVEHGWWIALDDDGKPNLWTTEFAIEEGRDWSPLGSSVGIVMALAGTRDAGVNVTVSSTGENLTKYRLQKQMMLSPIPHDFLATVPRMTGLKPLDDFWKSIPNEEKAVREELVTKFKTLTPQQALQARKNFMVRCSYEDLRKSNPSVTQERPPQRDPEDVEEVYRIFAAPLNVNWVPLQERPRKRIGMEVRNVDHSQEGISTQGQRTNSEPDSSAALGVVVQPSLLGRGRQEEEEYVPGTPVHIQHTVESVFGEDEIEPNRTVKGTLAPSEEEHGTRTAQAEESGRRVLRTNNEVGNVPPTNRSGSRGKGRSTYFTRLSGREIAASQIGRKRSTTQALMSEDTNIRTRSAAQRQRQRMSIQGRPVQGNDGEDADDDLEFSEEEPERRRTSALSISVSKAPVVFPSEAEYKAGYVWGQELVFQAQIEKIQEVKNADTNHRILLPGRVKEIYDRLRGPEADAVSAITLRPIAYLREMVNENEEVEVVQRHFSKEGAARELEFAFLHHRPTSTGPNSNAARTLWLENFVIWEPVDGQHIVAACKKAQEDNRERRMSDAEYEERFAKRKAKFVVYDNPLFYIEASVKINAREFDRKFITTYYEDIMKLRDIWRACGSPNALAREDDSKRAKALTMAASALHLSKDLPKRMNLRELAKRMVDYTRHAWNEDEESYKAVLQVCKDYEEGKLFFSKEEEQRWKRKARAKNLDETMDGSAGRKQMVQTWLRPLIGISRESYVRIAKQMAAKEVQQGRRESQRYYFNSATSKNPPKGTLTYAVDRLQRKDAVRNQIRFLMVEAGEESPSSMDDFFDIDASTYGDERGRQFTMMGQTLGKDSKTLWSAPIVKGVAVLRTFEHMIPAFIRQHYEDVKADRKGYAGFNRDVEDVGNARWDWQVALPTVEQGDNNRVVHVRCRGGFFEEEYVQIGKPCLWIFNCRRGGSEGEDKEWSADDYRNVFSQLQRWMTSIFRWNAVFLFPPGIYFDESMRTEMALPTGCTYLRGTWTFKTETVPLYMHDLRHGQQRQLRVQPVGDVAIIMQSPSECSTIDNFPRIQGYLEVMFQDSWNTEVLPRAEDKLERSPRELKKMIEMFLPRNWGLVVLGITMAVPTLVKTGFVGSDIIIMEGASTKTQFLFNTLRMIYGDKMVMLNNVGTTAECRISHDENEGNVSADASPAEAHTNVPRGRLERVVRSSSDTSEDRERFQVRERTERKRKGKEKVIDSEASLSSIDGSGHERRDSDELRSGGRSLGSSDTDAGNNSRTVREEFEETNEDPDYIPPTSVHDVDGMEVEQVEVNLPVIEVDSVAPDIISEFTSLESLPMIEGEDGYFYTKEGVQYVRKEREGRAIYKKVVTVSKPSSLPLQAFEEGICTTDQNTTVDREILHFSSDLSVLPIPELSMEENVETVHGGIGETSGSVESVLALSAFTNLESKSYTEGEDGFFYDRDRVRYERIEIAGQCTYRLVTSILEPPSLSPTVSEGQLMPTVDVMAEQAMGCTSSPTLSPNVERIMDEDIHGIAGIESQEQTQASVQVVETPEEELL